MNISEIFNIKNNNILSLIKKDCSDFLLKSYDNPLIKNLPNSYEDFKKVKIRIKKRQDIISELFNNSFNHSFLKEKSLFVNGFSKTNISDNTEPFYIFPINGFNFMFNPKINSIKEYYESLIKLNSILPNNVSNNVLIELFKLTYIKDDFKNAILSEAEIIIYNIPFYYCVKTKIFKDYKTLLLNIK